MPATDPVVKEEKRRERLYPCALQIPQLINASMAEHFEVMRSNQQEHRPNFPAGMPHLQHHADLSFVLGYTGSPDPVQAGQADDTDSDHASQSSDGTSSQQSPWDALTCAQDSWPSSERPIEQEGREHYLQGGSPEHRASSPSFLESEEEDDFEGSGAFSPQYEATSPSYSPRASQDGIARPSTACGRSTTQQPAGGSAFCFGRSAMAQVAPASEADAANAVEDGALDGPQVSSHSQQEPAEDAHQGLTTGFGTNLESTDLDPSAQHHAAAVLSELASRLQQAEAVQTADVHPVNVQRGGVQAAHVETETVQAEAMQAAAVQAETVQLDAVPTALASQASGSGSNAQPTFVWGQSAPSASNSSGSSFFGSSTSTLAFSTFQAGGSSPKQPSQRHRKASSRQQPARGMSASKQPGGLPAASECAHKGHGEYATASGHSDAGAESRNAPFSFGADAAEHSPRIQTAANMYPARSSQPQKSQLLVSNQAVSCL